MSALPVILLFIATARAIGPAAKPPFDVVVAQDGVVNFYATYAQFESKMRPGDEQPETAVYIVDQSMGAELSDRQWRNFLARVATAKGDLSPRARLRFILDASSRAQFSKGLELVQRYGPIKNLFIWTHMNSGRIAFGRDISNFEDLAIDRLRLAPGATIALAACAFGKGERGQYAMELVGLLLRKTGGDVLALDLPSRVDEGSATGGWPVDAPGYSLDDLETWIKHAHPVGWQEHLMRLHIFREGDHLFGIHMNRFNKGRDHYAQFLPAARAAACFAHGFEGWKDCVEKPENKGTLKRVNQTGNP